MLHKIGFFLFTAIVFTSCWIKTNDKILGQSSDSLEYDPSYEEMKKEYIQRYRREEIIDTTFQQAQGKVSLQLIHLCLFDSLTIPAKYNWGNNENFHTHNFASELRIFQAGDTILTATIEKDMFNTLLSDELKKYGVLMYPSLRDYDFVNGVFKIHYSLSIPLTDVGVSVVLEVGVDGTMSVKND